MSSNLFYYTISNGMLHLTLVTLKAQKSKMICFHN